MRPPGWIVRAYLIRDSTPGQSCHCRGALLALVFAETDPRKFVDATQRAASGHGNDNDRRRLLARGPHRRSLQFRPRLQAVAGQVTVTRTSPNGSPVSGGTVAPRDRLVIGWRPRTTSGEGNPERLALLFRPALGWRQRFPNRAPDPMCRLSRRIHARNGPTRWCHRSVYSWQIRTALDAALMTPTSPSPPFYLMAVQGATTRWMASLYG